MGLQITRFFAICLMLCLSSEAQSLSLAPVFAEGMVLQRDQPIPVWGKAEPGQVVAVSFTGQRVQTTADPQGDWRAVLEPMKASANGRVMRMTAGGKALEIQDVLVGEVWLLAGQSNMDFPLGSSTGAQPFIEAIVSNASIRLLDPPRSVPAGARAWPLELCQSLTPQSYFKPSPWVGGDAQVAKRFSAVGSVFGVRLHEALDVPIGLIDVSVGGSTTESWVPRNVIIADKQLAPLETHFLETPMVQDFVHNRPRQHLAAWLRAGSQGPKPEHPYRSGFLYSAAIQRIAPLPIAGILWYQGESNAEDAELHNALYQLAVASWREAFNSPELPVFSVQLPELNRECWPEFRAAQHELANTIPHAAMVVALGNGHPTNVHPRDKAPVGDRLARLALRRIYGKDIEDSGPVLIDQQRIDASLRLSFDHEVDGLELRWQDNDKLDDGQTTGFWIAGDDRVFHRAQVKAINADMLELLHPKVPLPIAARYAWEADVIPTLYNSDDLPAAPFRTDDWEPIRVACVGDSITHGTGTGNPDSESYPAQLSQMVGPLFDVRRFGVPGSSVVNGLIQPGTGWDRGYILQRAFDRSVVFEPDVVIINLGINDVVNENFNVGVFVADYVALVNAYRRLPSKPTVVIWSRLSPLFPGQAFFENPRLELIQQALDKIVEQTGVETIDMHAPLKTAGDDFPDKLHPDASGAKRIAEQTRDKLKAMGLPIVGEAE